MARWQASKVAPYLSRGLFAMTFVESTEVPTLGIDAHWRVYANPDYIAKCASEGTLVGEVLHECLHPTLRHGPRAKTCNATDHAHWNGCADAELDQRIEGLPAHKWVKLVADRVTPESLGGAKGMPAEELYHLPRKQSSKSKCGGGSGASGKKEAWEKPGDAPGLTEAQGAMVAQQIAQDVKQHAQSKGRGSVPAGILRWAEDFGDAPPIDWGTLAAARIAYVLDAKRGEHPSYARPSRRGVGGLVLPVHRNAVPRVGLVIDTSASMGSADIGKALAVTFDACAALGKVFAVSCDSRAGEVAEIWHIDDLKPFLRGGGGTDLRIGISRALEEEPDAIVVVTDGDTSWPETDGGVATVIVLTRPCSYPPPAWADDVILAS